MPEYRRWLMRTAAASLACASIIGATLDTRAFAADLPADTPADLPTNQPTNVPANPPTDLPTNQPTHVPADTPADVPAELPATGDPSTPLTRLMLQIHGFVGQGALKSTGNSYLADSKRGSLEFSDIGINFTAQLTERLRVGMQFFARKLGSVGNFNAKTDWFYLDYHWRDWLGLRAGRVKLPFGLYNDTSDIDSARVFVLLPGSIYPVNNRDVLLAQTGFEAYGYAGPSVVGALEYRLYAGTILVPINNAPDATLLVQTVTVPYVVGGRLMWETPVEGLRMGGTLQALRLDTMVANTTGGQARVRVPAVLTVASAEYTARDLLLAAEYSRWYVSDTSSDTTVYPSIPRLNSDRAYVLATYQLRRWLAPGVYYSLLFANIDQRSGRGNRQHDIAGTLRFDINAHWIVKLEAHYFDGTAGLDREINGGPLVDLGTLTERWALFLLKTTAYF